MPYSQSNPWLGTFKTKTNLKYCSLSLDIFLSENSLGYFNKAYTFCSLAYNEMVNIQQKLKVVSELNY